MKAKKFLAMLLSAVTLASVGSMAACGKSDEKESAGVAEDVVFDTKSGEMYYETKAGKTPVKITYSEGNGREWMQAAASSFLKSEAGKEYYIVLTVDANITSGVSAKLEAGTDLDDLYYLLASPWQSYAALDQLEKLDDLYNTTIEGESKTILEKTTSAWKHYGETYNKNELGYYIFPSFTTVTGFVYNKTMFDQYGWEVPATVSELETLCQQIVADTKGSVAPFVYPGTVAGGYWDFVGTNWWLQVSGVEKMNEFMTLESYEVFNADVKSSPSYGKLKMLKTFENLIAKNKSSYILKNSGSFDHYQAQQAFGAGLAAMIPNGSWIQNESGEDIEDEIRMMPTPLMDGALTDENGKPYTYNYSGQPPFVAIPKKAENKEGAKAFLAYCCRDEILQLITKLTGTALAFDYSIESIELNGFQQSCIDIWKDAITWFEDSKSPLWTNNKVKKFNGINPYTNLIINYPSVTADSWCASEYASVKGSWSTFQ